MKPSAGSRDTLITFLKREATVNEDYGTREYTWVLFAQEMAKVQDQLLSRAERIADSLSIQLRPCIVECLYRDDITSDMQVATGIPLGATLGTAVTDYTPFRRMEIAGGPIELGRRDGLQMNCQELSTQGDVP